MNQKYLLTAVMLFLSVSLSAQYIVKDEEFWPAGVSNEGKVAGYEVQSGPYYLWLPDSGNVITAIGGLAPGNGGGGQTHFSSAGNIISGTSMGANGPEMSKYDRSTGLWTALGSLGFSVGGNYSSGYTVSGD